MKLFLFLLVSGGAFASVFPPPAHWFQCQTDAECVQSVSPCGGPTAVNRKFEEVHRKNAVELGPVMDCAVPSVPSVLRPVCQDSRCHLLKNRICNSKTYKPEGTEKFTTSCRTSADCESVEGVCGWCNHAVAQSDAARVRSEMRKIDGKRSCSSNPAPAAQVDCVDSACVFRPLRP